MILLSSEALTLMHVLQHTHDTIYHEPVGLSMCKTILLRVTVMYMCAASLIIVFVYSCAAHAGEDDTVRY